MIQDLIVFINDLSSPHHEVILLLDANETFISSECVLSKLTRKTSITDPIFNKRGNNLKPNTYKRGISRIDFCFCTPHIKDFIISCEMTPFDLFTSSDHRGIYLDVNILAYWRNFSIISPTSDSRLLSSTNSRATTQYKQELMKLFLKTINIIQRKIDNNSINESDKIQVNKVDITITKCMLKVDNKIKHSSHSHAK